MEESQNKTPDGDSSIKSSDEDGDENDSIVDPKMQQGQDDNAESLSSNGSDNGKGNGSGSGEGYSADCSSSDASTNDALKGSGTVPENEMEQLRLGGNETKTNSKDKDVKKSKNKDHSSLSSLNKSAQAGGDFPRTSKSGSRSATNSPSLPQWNGVRIQHPMDPRIDISTVGHIQTSSLSVFPAHVHNGGNHNANEVGESCTRENETSPNQPPPSIDQYMTLMEVVRPFFHAHGITNPAEEPLERRIALNKQSNVTALTSKVKDVLDESGMMGQEAETVRYAVDTAPTRSQDIPPANDSDGSSMVVLARVKRKHLGNRSLGNPETDDTSSSSNGGSNVSSATNSDRRVRIQFAERHSRREESNRHDEGGRSSPHHHVQENEPEMQGRHARDRQEHSSASASSSESQNNANVPVDAPLGLGVPAVVSEYSSSRVGSSGSNTHQSSSGSGSAGNTGSATGSGSNQGGSSGSGNDQGGMSSNGVGSSGSGNDVKGSGEETMDNSAANNSGEGNSDESNSNSKLATGGAGEPAHAFVHPSREQESPTQSINAVREKKLIDKKRKRMNMRREYEEKVQQEMESSGGSDENASMKPGRPITLDKVLSLTKRARIVVNASPPFLVVHTNAAYCRLSGIDSHVVIGKPISNLLSIPDPQTLEGMKAKHLHSQETPRSEGADEFGSSIENPRQASTQDDIVVLSHAELREGLTAAEAAGRARAAASQEDSVERLVATSGFGRYNIINLSAKPSHDSNFGIGKPPEVPAQTRNREEGSNGSSITSSSELYRQVTCSMGISPVVSSPEAFTAATDKDQESHHHKSKRRKLHSNETASSSTASHHLQPRRTFPHREVTVSRKRQLITHYAIQLEPIDGGYRKPGSTSSSESSISPTLEAQLLGLTTSELRRQRELDAYHGNVAIRAANPPEQDSDAHVDDDAMESESSNPHECVTAVG